MIELLVLMLVKFYVLVCLFSLAFHPVTDEMIQTKWANTCSVWFFSVFYSDFMHVQFQ